MCSRIVWLVVSWHRGGPVGEEFKLYQQECVNTQPPNLAGHAVKATSQERPKAHHFVKIKYSSFLFQDDAEGLYCQEQINRSGSSN